MACPFFNSEERWTARLLGLGVLGLTMLQMAVAQWAEHWNRDFFNALEARDWKAFLARCGCSLVVRGGHGNRGVRVYLKQLLQLRWRRWLT